MSTNVSAADPWTPTAYNASAAFVPQLTTRVLHLLDPQPTDQILEIGSGNGQLTAQIATDLLNGRIHGLDSSQNFITSAQTTHAGPNITYKLQDCTRLNQNADLMSTAGQWDKLFSNATLHWVLRPLATRQSVFSDFHHLLKPKGLLVFEMGGAGNVAETHAAFVAALTAQNVSVEKAREFTPWFFPSEEWMRLTLERAGFVVEVCEIEYRPTKLMPKGEGGQGGLEGWVRLMGAGFLKALGEEDESGREAVVGRVCEVLDGVVTRVEDGSQWLGYVRLRVVARKR